MVHSPCRCNKDNVSSPTHYVTTPFNLWRNPVTLRHLNKKLLSIISGVVHICWNQSSTLLYPEVVSFSLLPNNFFFFSLNAWRKPVTFEREVIVNYIRNGAHICWNQSKKNLQWFQPALVWYGSIHIGSMRYISQS